MRLLHDNYSYKIYQIVYFMNHCWHKKQLTGIIIIITIALDNYIMSCKQWRVFKRASEFKVESIPFDLFFPLKLYRFINIFQSAHQSSQIDYLVHNFMCVRIHLYIFSNLFDISIVFWYVSGTFRTFNS